MSQIKDWKRQEEKSARLADLARAEKAEMMKRIGLWLGVGLGLLALVILLAQLASSGPPPGSSRAVAIAPVTEADKTKGDPNAPVTLIEYSDFQCPACGSYYPMLKQIAADLPHVRFVYRHFPLPQHKNARLAAAAAEAAGRQGKFWEMHDKLFENQGSWALTSKAEQTFVGYATDLGLDTNRFQTDLSDPTIAQIVEDQRLDGDRAGFNSTPTFVVNGEVIPNPTSYDAFKAILEPPTP